MHNNWIYNSIHSTWYIYKLWKNQVFRDIAEWLSYFHSARFCLENWLITWFWTNPDPKKRLYKPFDIATFEQKKIIFDRLKKSRLYLDFKNKNENEAIKKINLVWEKMRDEKLTRWQFWDFIYNQFKNL